MIRSMYCLMFVSLFSVVLRTSVSLADDQRRPFGYRLGAITNPVDDCCWHPNNYCRKPQPGDPCPAPGCYPNCYNRKPEPCLPCSSGCVTANDYLRKCFPRSPTQCASPGLPRGIYSGSYLR